MRLPNDAAQIRLAQMRLARSAEQEQFAAALHEMLTDADVPGADSEPGGDGALRAARRWAAGDHGPGLALWRTLAGLGVTALAVPEHCGGFGATPSDVVVACEELGHHAVPGPVAESVAAVPQLLAALSDEPPRDEHPCAGWLRGLAAGELIATLAMPPRLPYAVDADAAGLVLLVEADAVYLGGVPGARHQSVDGTRWLFEVCGGQMLARGPAVAAAAAHALDFGALASAAQLLGAGRAMLEASVRHARQRVQFGRPIGAFQAVKHHLADVAIRLEFARPLLDAAAIALADGSPTASRDVSAAKVACAGPASGPEPESPPGYDRTLWKRLCGEIGVAGLAVPERYGGAGAGPFETHIVLEQLGRTLTPSPMLGSVLATQALLASGDTAACQRLLPAIADGTAIAALAWTGPAGHWDPGEVACHATAIADPPSGAGAGTEAGGWVLNGEAHYVLDGDVADVLLVAARTRDGMGLFDVDPRHNGVTREAVTTMDSTRRLAVVRLADAAGQRTGDCAALAQARDIACIALSAEQVGAAQHALQLTVAYTKVRVQFGRIIGSFQVLQHRMADLHVLVESARSLSYAAASAAADEAPDLGLRAAAAKVYCSEVLARVAGEMIQLHGAIGITWEHDAHRYLKRAHGAAQLFGQPAEHVARIAAALIDR